MSYQKHNFEAGAVLFASQLNDMDNQIEVLSNQESTLSENFKVALLNCFENVAWVNQNGQSYYNELYNALYPDIFWTVTNTLSNCTNSNNTTNVLKNSSYVATIIANEGYTLDGATVNISMGGNDVTNLYYSSGSINIPNVTGDLVITVTAISNVVSISAMFIQGSATIYDTDSLNILKQYLTVTATYADSTTATVSDYTLSGTLAEGTSTITVSYGGKTDTFNVTVSKGFLYTPDKGILSDQPYITKTVVTAQSSFTETITDGSLRLYCPKLSSATGRIVYSFDPPTFSSYCKLKVEFKIADMSWTKSANTAPGWVVFHTAKSEASLTSSSLGFSRVDSNTGTLYLKYEVENSPLRTQVSLNAWHTLEVENTGGGQTITLDNVVVANSVAEAEYAIGTPKSELSFSCGNTNANNIYINRIEFECD